MSRRYYPIAGVAVPLALAAFWWLAPHSEPTAAKAPADKAQTAAGVLVVDAKRAAQMGIRLTAATVAEEAPLVTIPAVIQPPANARVAVAATFPGVVTRTYVVEGDSVRQGQALATVASREVLTLGSDLTRAHARAGVAQSNAARLSQLSREGIIAPARADEARAIAAESNADVSEKARILRMVGGHGGSGSYTLTAPIAGRVTSAAIQTGNPVDGTTAPYVIDAANRYEVIGQLPERLVGQVRLGMTVHLPPDISGRIIAVGSTIDPATRSASLKAEIPAGPGVVAGRATSIVISGPAPAGAVSVPETAVTMIDGRSAVFVAAQGGYAVRPVTSGTASNGRIVLLSGVKPGEQVVTSGTSALKALAAARQARPMLRSLVATALSYRLLVLLLAAVTAGLGIWAFVNLPVDAYPNIAQTQVKLILKAPGMTPEEVESRVITPIEQEMLGIPNQAILRSAAKYAIADITIDFTDGTDIYWARQQVAERLSGVMGDLPASVTGGLAPISTPLSDVYMFTIEGPLSLQQKRELLDWTIRPALRTVPGVADVNALGGYVRTFEVRPDPVALASAKLSIADLRAAIESGNRNDGAGRLANGEEALIVRAVGAIRNAEDLQSLVIASRDGRIVRLGDVASVGSGSLTRYGAVTKNGNAEAVEGLVIALRGADARQVVDGVRTRLAEVERGLPAGTRINVFYDRSDLIERAVGTVEEALIEATVLVVVLLILFLGDWRAAAIVAATLPMAALITFLFMRGMGLSANLMSLGGLAIAIGMLVDGAVVVVENVVERLGRDHDGDTPRLNHVFRATSEVIVPVSAGILIIALVFLPLLSLQGLEGKLFAPVALTIVFALAGSLLLALTLVPVLSSFGLKSGHHGEPWIMRQLGPRYRVLLDGAFARKRLVYGLSALGLVLAGIAYGAVGKTFMPTMDEGSVIVQLTKLPSINLDQSVAGDLAVQRALRAVPEVEDVIARVGSDEIGLDPMGLNETDSFVRLKPRSEWRGNKDFVIEEIRKALEGLPGITPSYTQPIEMRVSEMLTGARGDLAVKIFGPDLNTLADLAGQIQHTLSGVRGASEVLTVANDSVDYLQLDIDRAAAGRFGMPVDQMQDALRAQVEGMRAGVVAEGQKRTPIVIRGDESLRKDAARFADLQLRTPDGTLARVSDMARVARTQGPVKLDHENGSRFALVQAFVSGRDLVGYVDEAKAAVATKVRLPAGYSIVWGGQFENQQRASARLMTVIPIALGLIFLVLLATLRSLRASLLILANIPFAMVGGLVSLWVSGEYLSVPASVGFIALLGIAVLNGLVLVAYFRQLRTEGLGMAEAVRLGAQRRLRPVLMTASITAFGLVPLLFASGPGSEIQRPLAIVVIGGLITSTLLTLILLPILFERFGESAGEPENA